MSELIGPHARSVLLGDRRCTATNRSGERCGRASSVGAFVCDRHGGKSPRSLEKARERIQELVEPALDVLHRATRSAPACEHCGRSDADRDPTAVRAAVAILDRTGFHPTMSVEVAPPNPYAECSEDELIEKLETLLAAAKARRDQRLASVVDADAFVVPDDDEPIHAEDVRIPEGNDAADASKDGND